MDELLEGLEFPVADVPPAACGSAEAAVAFLVGALARAGHLREGDQTGVVDGVLRREARFSTGLGNGLALPHLATGAVERVVGVGGRAAAGVPWPGACDDGPVRHLLLLLTPASRPRETLLAQERVVRHLFRNPHAREQAVRMRAYRLWEAAGRPHGRDQHFWYEAERGLRTGG